MMMFHRSFLATMCSPLRCCHWRSTAATTTSAAAPYSNLRLFGTKSSHTDSPAAVSTPPPLALVFDTETTGLVDRKKPYTDPSQPELVQLGLILVDVVEWKKRLQVSLLVQSGHTDSINGTTNNNASIDPKAQQVHGISDADRDNFGVPLTTALQLFQDACAVADCLVAHNMPFDRTVLQASFHRVGATSNNTMPLAPLADVPTQNQQIPPEQHIFDTIPQICTMDHCTDILKLKQKYGKRYKWPSLEESYLHFTKINTKSSSAGEQLGHNDEEEPQGIQNAHDALADAEACLVVLRGLLESQAIDPIEKRNRHAAEPPNATNATSLATRTTPNKSPAIPAAAVTPTPNTTADNMKALQDEVVAQPGDLILDVYDTGFAVHGNTYKYKESLKALGANWSATKRAWVFECHSMLGPARKLAGVVPVGAAAAAGE